MTSAFVLLVLPRLRYHFRVETRLLAVLVACALPGLAQKGPTTRIAGPIDNSQMVALPAGVHPLAQPQYDEGPVDPSFPLPAVTLSIAPSTAQQAALEKLLTDQQNPASPSFHKWLTPEQFADRFGLSPGDIATLTTWLQSQGFSVVATARAHNWISFSGTAGQIANVFHTQIHTYVVDGETHFANSSPPEVPAALSGMISGFRGLNDFALKPMGVRPVAPETILSMLVLNPNYTVSGAHFLAPDDVSTIYDLGTLYSGGFDGTGQKIVIAGQSDITLTDIQQFRTGFNLSTNNPQVIIPSNSTDPGHRHGDEGESDLDLEWSGAVARNATLLFVTSNVNAGGVTNSVQWAVDNNLAPVISFSYGLCELFTAQAAAIAPMETLLKQANAQGITFVASSGDSGAAGCDNAGIPAARNGFAANYPASSPEATAVGGTEFNEGTGSYWNTSNGGNGGSAKSYIPEMGWNDSVLVGGVVATGGGKSSCATLTGGGACSAGFAKPSWQVATGVPADGVRDVPDISFAASADHDGFIFCTLGSCASGIASAVASGSIVGGTSASAPLFAGMVAILNQFAVAQGILTTPGFGNLNTEIYPMAQSNPAAFHDVVTGSNIVPCVSGTPNCPSASPFQFGYSATTGYDQVTGLGSLDAGMFVDAFSAPVSTTTTLSFAPTSVNAGTSVALTATVTPASGSSRPTGTVTFFNGSSQLGTATLSSGTATLTTSSFTTAGNYSVTASYGGGGKFTSSTSTAVSIPVVDFTLAASTAALSVTRGQSGAVGLTVSALNGFSSTLTYSCLGLPSGSSCVVSNLTVSGATVTIRTTAPTARLNGLPFRNRSGPLYALLLPGCLGVFLGGPKRRLGAPRARMLMLLLAASMLWMVACGGGGTSTPGNPGTPVGTYSVTIMGTTGGSNALGHAATPVVVLTVM